MNTATAIWNRRFGRTAIPATLSSTEAKFVENEARAALVGLIDSVPCLQVNRRAADATASIKQVQLNLASKLGFKIPRTLITNDPAKAIAFRDSVGIVVFKPVSGFALTAPNYTTDLKEAYGSTLPCEIVEEPQMDTFDAVYTQILTDAHIDHITNLRIAPVIFQEYIRKKLELRVTLVGKQLFACEIYSQEQPATEIDFRRFATLSNSERPTHKAVVLPVDLSERLLAFAATLDLHFACFDLILTPDGEYFFLEVNPNGQWLWTEMYADLPITSALCSMLISSSENHASQR